MTETSNNKMDEKIKNALLTSDEVSYVRRIKELEQIVESQKVTEQILVAELEKFKVQINAMGGSGNTVLEKQIQERLAKAWYNSFRERRGHK